MNDRLTEQQIQAMTERCEKATAGPWRFTRGENNYDDSLNIGGVHSEDWCVAEVCGDIGPSEQVEPNAQFIAHARTDLPACLREIGALQTDLFKALADHDAELSTLTQKLAEAQAEILDVDRENERLTLKLAELERAATGMLGNYIELKRMSLYIARSDAPNWIGRDMTPDDDIHVQAVRKALSTPTERPENESNDN